MDAYGQHNFNAQLAKDLLFHIDLDGLRGVSDHRDRRKLNSVRVNSERVVHTQSGFAHIKCQRPRVLDARRMTFHSLLHTRFHARFHTLPLQRRRVFMLARRSFALGHAGVYYSRALFSCTVLGEMQRPGTISYLLLLREAHF